MKAVRVDGKTERLLGPSAAAWRSAPEEALALAPTPLAAQPSPYILAKWAEGSYGAITEVRVRAVHNGEAILFRLSWDDETKDDAIMDTDGFPDGAAVLFPMKGDAPISNMGLEGQPVNAWYWRPDLERPINMTAQGLGTSVRQKDDFLEAAAEYRGGGWSVVIARPFAVSGQAAVALAPGQAAKVGFAVWQGSNQERAGLKAFTLDWRPLEIEG